MPSTFAWLDTSAEEQRKIRELVALFTEKETLDALGIGQIRDVFSNAMFPGLSVIQTRARYLLLVPWSFIAAARSTGRGTLRARADEIQRATVRTLLRLEASGRPQSGVIGARVGGDVKTLPSAIYWNALRTFGILRSDVDPENVTRRRTRQDDSDEVATRQVDQWSATIPPVPLGFPSSLPTGLDLSAAEAAWLQERMLQAVPDSLLVSMLKAGQPPSPTSQYPWDDPIIASVPTPIRQTVRHAQMFSLAIYGSSLLYSMEVARAYEEAGFNAVAAPVERLASAFERWTDDIDAMQADLRAWDRQAFWGSVLDRNQRITIFTRRFVDTWLDAVVDGRANEALEDPELRALVEDRERNTKRGQARLANKKLLGSWGGQAGAPLSYRWALAKTIVTDIDDGLRRTEDSRVSA